MTIVSQKSALRERFLDEIQMAPLRSPCQLLGRLQQFLKIQSGFWGFYRPFRGEVDVTSLSTVTHLKVCWPSWSQEPPMQFHFEEKVVPPQDMQGFLIPGLGFDENGFRLGRGKGFFDQYLAQSSGLRVGIARDFQVVPRLPRESHDLPMNYLFTETQVFDFTTGSQSWN